MNDKYNIIRIKATYNNTFSAILLVKNGKVNTDGFSKPCILTNFEIVKYKIEATPEPFTFPTMFNDGVTKAIFYTNAKVNKLRCIIELHKNDTIPSLVIYGSTVGSDSVELSRITGYIPILNPEQFNNREEAELFFELC